MTYWLVKSEPDTFSIDDLAQVKVEPWTGVRNYQARNYMRDQMQQGDLVLFYHSSCAVPAIVGLATVVSAPYADPTQFEENGEYFDPSSTPDTPRWQLVDLGYCETFSQPVTLSQIKKDPALAAMRIAQRGNRLSITPVSEAEFCRVCELGGKTTD